MFVLTQSFYLSSYLLANVGGLILGRKEGRNEGIPHSRLYFFVYGIETKNFATKYSLEALDHIYQISVPLQLSDLKSQQGFVTIVDVFLPLIILQETSPKCCNFRRVS